MRRGARRAVACDPALPPGHHQLNLPFRYGARVHRGQRVRVVVDPAAAAARSRACARISSRRRRWSSPRRAGDLGAAARRAAGRGAHRQGSPTDRRSRCARKRVWADGARSCAPASLCAPEGRAATRRGTAKRCAVLVPAGGYPDTGARGGIRRCADGGAVVRVPATTGRLRDRGATVARLAYVRVAAAATASCKGATWRAAHQLPELPPRPNCRRRRKSRRSERRRASRRPARCCRNSS